MRWMRACRVELRWRVEVLMKCVRCVRVRRGTARCVGVRRGASRYGKMRTAGEAGALLAGLVSGSAALDR